MYPRSLIVVLLGALSTALAVWAERAFRLAEAERNSPQTRAAAIPNYHHVWFAHEITFDNGLSGDLSLFGDDVVKTGGNWSELCSIDSDQDGETNGEELGDPCCRWTPSAPRTFAKGSQFEYRRWGLTHPGRDDDVRFGVQTRLGTLEPRSCDAPYDVTRYQSFFAPFYVLNHDLPLEVSSIKVVKVASLASLIAIIAYWFARCDLGSDICPWLAPKPRITGRTSVLVCIAAFVYMDLTSGIIHLILDYAPHSLPVLGDLARGFQYHHTDPTAIVRISWYAYVSHVHILCPIIALIIILAEVTRVHRLFWFWGAVFVHLFQTAHRWVHFHPSQLPWIVQRGQDLGLLLSVDKHMSHHEDLEHQFTILSGHTDIVLDTLSSIIPPQRYDLWLFVGVFWFSTPFVVDIVCQDKLKGLEVHMKDGSVLGSEMSSKGHV